MLCESAFNQIIYFDTVMNNSKEKVETKAIL